MQILCKTFFDCSLTGITGYFRPSQVPFVDQAGNTIETQDDWNRARNQQRNWETIMQMISLRAQPTMIKNPKQIDNEWQFTFAVETPGVYSINQDLDNTDGLSNECAGIPMITGLNETLDLEPYLIIAGQDQNIWFSAINNTLE
jgi:hypothetical protein